MFEGRNCGNPGALRRQPRNSAETSATTRGDDADRALSPSPSASSDEESSRPPFAPFVMPDSARIDLDAQGWADREALRHPEMRKYVPTRRAEQARRRQQRAAQIESWGGKHADLTHLSDRRYIRDFGYLHGGPDYEDLHELPVEHRDGSRPGTRARRSSARDLRCWICRHAWRGMYGGTCTMSFAVLSVW